MFSKNIRTIYLYFVSFITLFMLVGGIITAIYSATEYIFPNQCIINDNITTNIVSNINYSNTNRLATLKEIIDGLAFSIVALPVYIYSWKKIETERKESIETENNNK